MTPYIFMPPLPYYPLKTPYFKLFLWILTNYIVICYNTYRTSQSNITRKGGCGSRIFLERRIAMNNLPNNGFREIIENLAAQRKSLPMISAPGTTAGFKWWDDNDDGATALEKMPDREHHRMFNC